MKFFHPSARIPNSASLLEIPADATVVERSKAIPFQSSRTREAVLVVEAEPVLLEVAAPFLERCGYEVLTACNEEEAKAITRQGKRIDAAVTGVGTPEAEGGSFPAWLAARPATAIVFISDAPHNQGKSHLVEKPFIRLDVLVRAIREALEESRAERQFATVAA